MNDLLKWLRAQQEGHRATECRVPAPTTSEFFKAAADEIERLQDRNTELANALSFMTDALDREQSEETDDWEITDIRWREKIDQLQASVKKVPKTADGVPVVPGMVLYRISQSGCVNKHAVLWVSNIHWSDSLGKHYGPVYSTNKAAHKAAKKEKS